MALADMIYTFLVLVFLIVVFGIAYQFSSITTNALQNITEVNQTVSTDIWKGIQNLQNSFPLFITIGFFGFLIASLISAFLIGAHPIFLIVSIFFGIINILVAYAFQEAIAQFLIGFENYQALLNSNAFLSFAVSHLPLIASIITFLITLAMVIKNYVAMY
jgi:hypothetical protein